MLNLYITVKGKKITFIISLKELVRAIYSEKNAAIQFGSDLFYLEKCQQQDHLPLGWGVVNDYGEK